MAKITKTGQGGTTNTEQTGTTVSSIVLPAPGSGYANRILMINAVQRGGTSVRMAVNYQTSASADDPTPVNIDLAHAPRYSAGTPVSNWSLVMPKESAIKAGNNQQVTIGLTGDVNDSLETVLVVCADIVRAG